MGSAKKYFDFSIYRSTQVTIVLAMISLVLFFFLSPAAAYENGPLENFQVLELIAGAIFACLLAVKATNTSEKNIWYCGAVTFLICAGRELNWGRVFYPTAALNKFLPLKDLWYGPVVYPLVTLAAVAIICLFWRGRFFLFGARRKLPLWNCVLFVSLFLAADYAEHRPLSFFGQSYDGEILEELFECICYLMMIDIVRLMGGKGVKY